MGPSIYFLLIRQLCAEGLHCVIHCTRCTTANSRGTWGASLVLCIGLLYNVTSMQNGYSAANVVDMFLSSNSNTLYINTNFSLCTVIPALSEIGMYK